MYSLDAAGKEFHQDANNRFGNLRELLRAVMNGIYKHMTNCHALFRIVLQRLLSLLFDRGALAGSELPHAAASGLQQLPRRLPLQEHRPKSFVHSVHLCKVCGAAPVRQTDLIVRYPFRPPPWHLCCGGGSSWKKSEEEEGSLHVR